MRKTSPLPFLNLFCLIIDRFSKKLVLNNSKIFSGKILELELSKNQGLFFFSPNQRFLIILSFALTSALTFFLIKNYSSKNNWQIFSFLLIIGGGASNLYDRIIFGYVIDFIKISLLPFSTFNLADIMITGGIIIFLADYFLFQKNPKTATTDITKEAH